MPDCAKCTLDSPSECDFYMNRIPEVEPLPCEIRLIDRACVPVIRHFHKEGWPPRWIEQ